MQVTLPRNTARPFPFLMEKAAWICFRSIEGRAETESGYRSVGLQKRESIVNGGKPSKNLKELANILGHRTGESTLQVYVEQKPEIYEGVHQYFDLLAGSTGIQTGENGDLCEEKIVNNIEGYMAFPEPFIRGALE